MTNEEFLKLQCSAMQVAAENIIDELARCYISASSTLSGADQQRVAASLVVALTSCRSELSQVAFENLPPEQSDLLASEVLDAFDLLQAAFRKSLDPS